MIKTDELRGIIAKNGLSQSDVALKIGITPKTFYEKMKIGIFGSDEIQIMIDELDTNIIVDAGIGKPSQAMEAMEMGAAAIMANTAIATAGDIPAMAGAFKSAIEAGRNAYLAGLGRVLERGAQASDPLTGFLRD